MSKNLQSKTAKVLKEIALDLEPILGRSLRSSGPKELIIQELTAAIIEAGDEAGPILARYELELIELRKELRAAQGLDALDEELIEGDEPSTPVFSERELESLDELKPKPRAQDPYEHIPQCPDNLACIQALATPGGRLAAYSVRRGDIIVNPSSQVMAALRRLPHAQMSVEVARQTIRDGEGRLNRALSNIEGV